jgi:myo-inositol-1(or 4)-monophosphatase
MEMGMMNLEETRKDLESLLLGVRKVVQEGFFSTNDHKFKSKQDANDLLTKYDTKSNEMILEHLEKNYPDISIISEESPAIMKKSEYAFAIDPLDGTRNFVRNIPVFFVGIGLIKDNETVLSITINPITNEIFWAIKGKGAFRNGDRISVGKRTIELSDVVVRTLPDKQLEKKIVSEIVDRVHQVKNNMCSHEEISGVAFDRYDGFVSQGSSIWDYCHYLIVKEAGGKVTDWEGDAFDLSKKNIIVSNGIIHDKLIDAVKSSTQ